MTFSPGERDVPDFSGFILNGEPPSDELDEAAFLVHRLIIADKVKGLQICRQLLSGHPDLQSTAATSIEMHKEELSAHLNGEMDQLWAILDDLPAGENFFPLPHGTSELYQELSRRYRESIPTDILKREGLLD